jgi:hypothetical protein
LGELRNDERGNGYGLSFVSLFICHVGPDVHDCLRRRDELRGSWYCL